MPATVLVILRATGHVHMFHSYFTYLETEAPVPQNSKWWHRGESSQSVSGSVLSPIIPYDPVAMRFLWESHLAMDTLKQFGNTY